MRILHLVSGIGKRSFGLGPAPRFLAQNQSRLGHEVSVWTYWDTESDIEDIKSDIVGVNFKSYYHPISRTAGGLRLVKDLVTQKVNEFDLVHLHGVWSPLSVGTMLWRHRTRRPFLVAAQGSLQPWALRKSRWKKAVAARLYERRNLSSAGCLHAVSAAEACDYRTYGLGGPVAVIPNGIDDGWYESVGDGDGFRKAHGILATDKVFLFVSRISPKKGLPLLIRAIKNVQTLFLGSHLLIAGVDEFGHLRDVQRLVAEFNLGSMIRFIGPLYGAKKRDAFAAADVFVLPSYSEGAPMVVLEALSSGVPVVATRGSPWQELATHNCGWWTDVSVAALQSAIGEACAKSPSELRQMGARGRALVGGRYRWSGLACQCLDVYSWLVNGGRPPDCVEGSRSVDSTSET